MIAQLGGKIVHIGAGFIILDTGNIAYEIYVTPEELSLLSKSEKDVKLWTHLSVRENSHELFGFRTMEELSFFKMLIKISGVGPKGALSIMAVAPISVLTQAIAEGDTSYLTKVSGVGKKTAEKVVLELKDRFANMAQPGSQLSGDVDTLEALKQLGYSEREARDAVQKLPKEIEGVGERVKEALKILGNGK